MSQHLFIKNGRGYLVPATRDAQERLTKIPAGGAVHVDIKEERNALFFNKWHSLVRYAFNLWSERCAPREYKGKPITANYDRFRKDITILAGFFRPVYAVDGEFRLEAESIAFGRMSEERFDQLYSATIDVILNKVIPDLELTAADLEQAVAETLNYV